MDELRRSQSQLAPPTSLLHDGTSSPDEFRRIGRLKFQAVVQAGLGPTERILDVGFGNGQLAVPLAEYLRPPGAYEGFDIVPAAVEWCVDHITSQFPHMRFALADIYNKFYNPTGGSEAAEYSFPYASESFDFVFLGSVFTHMLTPGVERYVAEIARVLKPGGKCLCSYYLLNAESESAIAKGVSFYRFGFNSDAVGCRVENNDLPEAVVAHREQVILDLLAGSGLSVSGVHHGKWCSGLQDDQDAILAVKPTSDSIAPQLSDTRRS